MESVPIMKCQIFFRFAKDDYNYRHTAIHLNIHSLPAKHDQLQSMISELHDMGIIVDFIMLCETFLSHINCNMFPLTGYQFMCINRQHSRGGGVALYIRDNIHIKMRHDLCITHEREFESIFVEAQNDGHSCLVGEVYRVPGVNEQVSIERYETLLQRLSGLNWDVMLASDQNINYLDIEKHSKIRDFLYTFVANGFIPTIALPTRITHHSSTLIDNIYVKCKQTNNIHSGIITNDISDHLPIFILIGKLKPKKAIAAEI